MVEKASRVDWQTIPHPSFTMYFPGTQEVSSDKIVFAVNWDSYWNYKKTNKTLMKKYFVGKLHMAIRVQL